MSIDQATLVQMVYDSVFSQLIKPATGSTRGSEVLLSLEFPGQQLDESQYQNPWTPQNPGGSQFSTEMFSSLIDAIPLVDTVYVDSGVTVEEMYEFALGATAVPLSESSGGADAPNPVNTALNNARQLFEQTRLASTFHPAMNYHPSYATPSNWPDPLAAQGWTRITINSNQTTVKPDSPFLKFGGAKHLQAGIWKVSPKVQKSDLVVNPALSKVGSSPGRIDLGNMNQAITVNPASIGQIRPHSRAAVLSSPTERALTTSTALQLQQVSPNPLWMNRIDPDLITKVRPEVLTSRPIDQSTKDIQISFRCCRVNFNRPWLMKSLLEITGWTLPGQAPGSLSSGTIKDNNGIFPLLPIGFIAIRDLTIRGSWGQVDRETAAKAVASENSIGFGPFALSGRYAESGKGYQSSFDGVTISASGLQILGWINLVIPYAPPA